MADTGQEGGTLTLCALEWQTRRRMSEYYLGWGVIDDAGVERLIGVVNGGRGIVHNFID